MFELCYYYFITNHLFNNLIIVIAIHLLRNCIPYRYLNCILHNFAVNCRNFNNLISIDEFASKTSSYTPSYHNMRPRYDPGMTPV